MKRISEFKGVYYYLSNFYPADVTYKGITFKNNEAAFQAMKCPNIATWFATLNPSEAKKLGRRVTLGTPSDDCPADTNPRRSKIDLSKLVHTSKNSSELLPCPFCGGKVSLLICDDEGNVHDEEYEKDPWSGLSYKLEHTTNDDSSNECPIATDEGEGLGGWSYDTREEAVEAWNNRC